MSNRVLKQSRVLIIGGAGFMGSNFIHRLFADVPDVRVTNLDLLTYAGDPRNLEGLPKARYRFVEGDLVDEKLLQKLMRTADYVVNFAAETHVDRSIHGEADAFMRTNILGVHSLMKALKASPHVKCLVHISTDEVWGDVPLRSTKRFDESSPFLPNSPYAASKAAGDLLIRSYVKTYGVPAIVTHATNNFGPRQYPEKLIPFFISRALGEEPLPLYGNGLNRRDWLYVDDHSRAVLAVLGKGTLGDVYAIAAGGEEPSNKTVATQLLALLGKKKTLLSYVADRPAHDLRYAVNARKIRALGWKPRMSFDEGLAATVAWYRAHPERLSVETNLHIKTP
jgi:dTDP-glucose 4,6-dehydratase